MAVNTIAGGTTGAAAGADGEQWLLPAGETLSNDSWDIVFTFGAFSNVTLIVAGEITQLGLGSGIGASTGSAGNTLLVEPGGSVSGFTAGVVGISSAGSRIVNQGTITGNQSYGTMTTGVGSSLLNEGTITSTGFYGAVVASGGTATNSGTISTTAHGYAGLLFGWAEGGGLVTNSGTISGFYGVQFTDDGNTLVNVGTVRTTEQHAVFGGNGNDRVINLGRIEGYVSFGDGDDFLDSTQSAHIGFVFGEAGDDRLATGDGNNFIRGGLGNDFLSGGRGRDFLDGEDDNDVIKGNRGSDYLRGGAGDDLIRGGGGDDNIRGEEGADILFGGMGDDEMVGGTEADVFVFDLKTGQDTINDFENGIDLIDLTRLDIAGFAALNAAISIRYTHAFIDLALLGGSGTIKVKGEAGLLDETDFIL
ncbi:MAG: hypothetical protein KDK10_08645 [Maritimibacter sp.]|nr:hypothetical protein [Maritimibacter sp.]